MFKHLLSLLFCAVSLGTLRAQDAPVAPIASDTTFGVGHVQEQPEYPGGAQRMYKFLHKNVHYPKEARKARITGKVYVQFMVDKDGSIADVKVKRGVHPLLDAEAVRAVSRMPKWRPGYMDGKAVKCIFTLPINFKMR